jgi:hypothetical protein
MFAAGINMRFSVPVVMLTKVLEPKIPFTAFEEPSWSCKFDQIPCGLRAMMSFTARYLLVSTLRVLFPQVDYGG